MIGLACCRIGIIWVCNRLSHGCWLNPVVAGPPPGSHGRGHAWHVRGFALGLSAHSVVDVLPPLGKLRRRRGSTPGCRAQSKVRSQRRHPSPRGAPTRHRRFALLCIWVALALTAQLGSAAVGDMGGSDAARTSRSCFGMSRCRLRDRAACARRGCGGPTGRREPCRSQVGGCLPCRHRITRSILGAMLQLLLLSACRHLSLAATRAGTPAPVAVPNPSTRIARRALRLMPSEGPTGRTKPIEWRTPPEDFRSLTG
jgi:hypothetical protein